MGAVSLVPRGYFCFATALLFFLLTLREEGCGGEKEMLVLAFLLWKRKIRNGVMGKAPLSLLALHKRENWRLEEVWEHDPSWGISSYRFCTTEGILGCYWSPSRPLHTMPYRDTAAPAPCPAASQQPWAPSSWVPQRCWLCAFLLAAGHPPPPPSAIRNF